MSKQFYIACLVVCAITLTGRAQTVSVYKIDELLKRIHNNSDTTYIINFWATWCKPCVAELPEFEKFHQLHKTLPVKIILVSMDFKEDLNKKLIPFISKNNYSSEVVLLDEVNGNDFIDKIHTSWSGSIPATLITSKNKRRNEFIEKTMSYKDLEEALKR